MPIDFLSNVALLLSPRPKKDFFPGPGLVTLREASLSWEKFSVFFSCDHPRALPLVISHHQQHPKNPEPKNTQHQTTQTQNTAAEDLPTRSAALASNPQKDCRAQSLGFWLVLLFSFQFLFSVLRLRHPHPVFHPPPWTEWGPRGQCHHPPASVCC